MNLKIKLAGLELRNPTILASGILGIAPMLLKRCELHGVGAVTTKSFGKEPREGHNNPTVLVWDNGLINAIGLANPGYKSMEFELKELKKELKVPVIASIFGTKKEEFAEVAEAVAGYGVDAIELNVSCPNVEKHGQVFGLNKEIVSRIVEEVKAVSAKVPIIPKLTPQAVNIADIAFACEQAGADAISAINTLGPGMVIDIETGKPMLGFKRGGISGPAIKPIAIRCVYDIYEKVKIPIIGIGGISTGKDAIEMVQAGATAIGIGSGVYYRGIEVFEKVCKEMQEWMKMHGYKSLEKLRGIAHN